MTAFSPADGPFRGATPTARDAAFAAVTSVLWSERELLERVLFKLMEEQLILSAGAVRWLSNADEELQSALQSLRESEVLRAIEIDELTSTLGVPSDTTLRELAVLAPEPWKALLTEHRNALTDLAAEITSATGENRRLLHSGAEAARQTLNAIGHAVPSAATTYAADGSGREASLGPLLLDRQA